MSFQQRMEVQDESLLGEEARSSLLRRKLGNLKASVRPIDSPKYVFNATCNGVPQDIRVGTRLEFEVIIQPERQLCTSEVEPKVSLDSCTMTLIAQTSGPHPTHIEVSRQRHRAQRPPGPFSKAAGYRKIVDLGVLGHVPSTFNFSDVSQSYKLRLEIQFHAANNTVVMRRECPVIFNHPDTLAESNGSARGSSLENSGLPTYEEAMMAGRGSVDSARSVR